MRPETHFRIGLALLPARARADGDYSTAELNTLVRSGMTHAISTTYTRDRQVGTGTMEARGHGPTREYRFPVGTHPCPVCGEEVENILCLGRNGCPACEHKMRVESARVMGSRQRLPLYTCSRSQCGIQFQPYGREQRFCSKSCASRSRGKVK